MIVVDSPSQVLVTAVLGVDDRLIAIPGMDTFQEGLHFLQLWFAFGLLTKRNLEIDDRGERARFPWNGSIKVPCLNTAGNAEREVVVSPAYETGLPGSPPVLAETRILESFPLCRLDEDERKAFLGNGLPIDFSLVMRYIETPDRKFLSVRVVELQNADIIEKRDRTGYAQEYGEQGKWHRKPDSASNLVRPVSHAFSPWTLGIVAYFHLSEMGKIRFPRRIP